MTGECSRCGECCRWLVLCAESTLTPDKRRYLELRGAVFKQGLVLLDYPCAMLNKFAGKSYCAIHTSKPDVCRQYHGKKRGKGIIFYVPESCTL